MESDVICNNCGHKKKSHYWRPYGTRKIALGCHKKGCNCKSFKSGSQSLKTTEDKDV